MNLKIYFLINLKTNNKNLKKLQNPFQINSLIEKQIYSFLQHYLNHIDIRERIYELLKRI